MADNLTPDEQRALIVKKTLESKLIQTAVGANHVKSNPFLYGELGLKSGEKTYSGFVASEEANAAKNEIYSKTLNEREELGIAEEAPFPTSYDLMAKLKTSLMETQTMATLGELEEHAIAVGATLNFKVPEELKKYTYQDLIGKAITEDKKVDLRRLTDKESDAFKLQGYLVTAYERALGLMASQANYFEDINDGMRSVIED